MATPAKVPAPVSATPAVPPFLATMRAISGTAETPGSGDNPKILAMHDEIAKRFPEMATYAANYTHDSIPWCGLTVAYCMAMNGIRPVFNAGDTGKFLWADAWAHNYGTPLSKPKLGCVMVFTRSGGGHVALYEGEDDDNYIVRGGNQSDAINVTHMPKSQLVAAIWPPDPILPAGPEMNIVQVAKAAAADASNFNKVLPWLLEDEGGFTDEATDAGGPTNWGITLQDARMYWKPDATAADVRAMPKEVAVSIFRAKYWDKMHCDELPSGVDYAVFDFGVNSGVSRAAKFLQNIVGTDQDGEIGPLTIAATIAADPAHVINTLCDDRMEFLRNAHNTTTGEALWPTYGRGWTRRVAGVRARSLELIGARRPTRETTMAVPATPPPASKPTAAPQINIDELAKLIAMVRQLMAAVRPTAGDTPIVFPTEPMARPGAPISDATQSAADSTVENMSPIDKVLGGKMFVGTKTGIGIVGLTALYILNHLGVVGTPDGTATTTTGAVLTGLSGGLTALGATAKVDRAVQALQKIATVLKPLIPIIVRALTTVA
jgi:uncharacterized protein (TIGR02594 family)